MEITSRRRRRRRRSVLVLTVVSIAALSIGVPPAIADHGLPHATVIQRATFSDDVAAQVRVKRDGRATEVVNVKEASDALLVTIVIDHGAVAPWHGHSGPGFLLNAGPGTLTHVVSTDCITRQYPPGTAFVDPGMGTLHAAWNDSGEQVVIHALFLGITDGLATPADPPADCDVLP